MGFEGGPELPSRYKIRTDRMDAEEFHRYHGCISKDAYTSDKAAEKVRKRMANQFGGEWCVYPCQYCFQLHVGSVSGRYENPHDYKKDGWDRRDYK